MKKIIYIISSLLILLFLLYGCNHTHIKVKEDLRNYVNSINSINALRNDALNDYSGIVGKNYRSDENSLVVLSKIVIPKYNYFLENLKRLNPSCKEVRELHTLYLNASVKQISSLNGFREAMEKRDKSILKENERLFKESSKELKQFKKKLKKLASKYKLNLDLEL
ncbi:hypothetical protein HAHI6034_07410 [Hathewaya histolytica]|uniref:Lipoprotein n=1 Tax=Hathewaya histolytica TaxID=1498 RepID=A0A4U9QVX5_HATHI|nr:hypothetical protein [Hathewaya histolytica]VTQ82722.1 Uncharacterised protein [Hathewaya histolytica]